jgi:hypothetical protein
MVAVNAKPNLPPEILQFHSVHKSLEGNTRNSKDTDSGDDRIGFQVTGTNNTSFHCKHISEVCVLLCQLVT